MKKVLAWFVAVLSSCVAVIPGPAADDPALKIEGADKWPSCALVRLKAVGLPPDATVRWRIAPDKDVERADTAPDVLQFTAPQGTYRVEVLAVAVVEGKPRISEAVKQITIGGPEGPSPDPSKDIRAAIGKVRFGNAGCTATIVHPRRPDGRWDVVCAGHCVSGVGQAGSIELKDGRVLALLVTKLDRVADVSWMATQSAILDNLPSGVLAKEVPPVGTKIAHSGYGYDRPGNTEVGVVAGGLTADGMLQFDLNVSSGDSGGAIYRTDNQEIVATVCCTQRIAGFARMYGGSCVRAWQIRPKGEVAELFDWTPAPMPTPNGHGKPDRPHGE